MFSNFLTHSIEQSPSSDADSRLARQYIPYILYNPKVLLSQSLGMASGFRPEKTYSLAFTLCSTELTLYLLT
jgi:hypothetical protein